MTKIFVIGDPHFKINNIDETNEMSTKILSILDQLIPDAVVCLGDVLDRHETIHVGPLLRSIDLFQKISEKYKLYILIGNHDRPSNKVYLTDEHPFTALKQWKNTIIVDTVLSDVINNTEFLFVPYVPPGRFLEAINTYINCQNAPRESQQLEKDPDSSKDSLSRFRCIFAHQEFYGAKMGITESKVGDVWDEDNPLVISGHIHDFDRLAENIIYTGTPIQHSFGDRDDKRVFLFTFDSDKHFKYDSFDLDLPKKKIIRISFSEIELIKKLDPKSHYKIVISGTPEELKTIKLGPFLQNLPRSKIVYKTISSTIDKISQDISFDTKSFLEVLLEEIERKDDLEERSDMIDMYQELFGTIASKNIENQFIIL